MSLRWFLVWVRVLLLAHASTGSPVFGHESDGTVNSTPFHRGTTEAGIAFTTFIGTSKRDLEVRAIAAHAAMLDTEAMLAQTEAFPDIFDAKCRPMRGKAKCKYNNGKKTSPLSWQFSRGPCQQACCQ
mmetsp:Transcript_41409/g.61284  ORF Transcript_41409/g.61284 Transcript_41409/m.61284 type:complete len:128 (+) Transcript_41409:177-560(+)